MKYEEPRYLEAVKRKYLWGTEEWLFWEEELPLLIKVIHAREALSLQVHPGDAYAWQQEGSRGKAEMWYVLDHKPGAFLYYGLKNRVTEREFRKRIQNGTLTEICKRQPVKKGDVFYIPPGMLHGIGGGIRVAEVQQNSQITYRVYDYNRVDQMQRPRMLHIRQATEVTELMPALGGHCPLGQRERREGHSRMLLVRCPYFSVWIYQVETRAELRTEELCWGGDFLSLLVLEGEGRLCWKDKGENGREKSGPLRENDSIYLPMACGAVEIQGKVKLFISGF